METKKTIIKLLYRSSGWLLRFSFLALPVSLFLSISSYLFVDNLLNSYERYLENSYLGVQGRVSIESKDKKLIEKLKEYSSKKKLKHSIKQNFMTTINFISDNNKTLSKNAEFIVLESGYMKQKFKRDDITKKSLIVNKVFTKSISGIDVKSLKRVYFDNKDKKNIKSYKIDKIIVADTGFLTSKPIIFISFDFAKELFKDIKSNIYKIEFLEKDKKIVDDIKSKTKEFAKELKTSELKIHDLILDTKDTKELFEKINKVQQIISLLIAILSIGIIILSISISIEFKRNSLKILQLIRMSSRDLATTISLVVFVTMVGMIFLSLILVKIYQYIFISLVDLDKNFFIPLDIEKILIIFGLAFILSLISFLTTKYIFRNSK